MYNSKGPGRLIGNIALSLIFLIRGMITEYTDAGHVMAYLVFLVIFNSICTFLDEDRNNDESDKKVDKHI